MVLNRYIGIDLTTMSSRPSTIAVLSGKNIFFKEIREFIDLVNYIKEIKPNLISIDAPLQIPKGHPYRDCDLKLKKLGMRPLPVMWRGMLKLTETAIKLTRHLKGMKLLETFPTGALNYIGLQSPKNRREITSMLSNLISAYSLRIVNKFLASKDVLDSLISVLAAYLFHQGKMDEILIIKGKECEIVIPILHFT